MDGQTILSAVALVIAAYACGSIPVGVLVARASRGPDPRSVGSGRTGATNALRALGPRGAVAVVLGDTLKGAVAVLLARIVTGGNPTIEVLCGLAAVVGSARSMFLGFGGGRGVVTLAGTMLVIAPVTVALAAPVFVIVVAVTRYVSLGSLLGSAALLPAVLAVGAIVPGGVPLAYIVHAAVGPVIVWVAHADNIDRLIHGTERKFDFGLLGGRGN
jgi:acyl phosphate:glycerol-3-phosphate acyltransferase